MNENIDKILDKPVSINSFKNRLHSKYDDRTFWSQKKFLERDYFKLNNEAYYRNKSIEAFNIEKEFDSILRNNSLIEKYNRKPSIQRSPNEIIFTPNTDGFNKSFILTEVKLNDLSSILWQLNV